MNDRRDELQQNELAIYLDRINKSIEPYSRQIAIVVGAAIIAVLGWLFYNTQQTEQQSDATLQLMQASASGDPEVLATVSDTYPGTLAGSWARLYQGNEYLGQGINALYADREEADQLLADARNAFANAMSGPKDDLLVSRAHFGLARVAESLGELDKAIEEYEATIATGESDEMIAMAESRIESLNSPATKGFLAWFSEQDFAPADPSMPPALPGASSLPDMPDLDLPPLDLPKLDLPGGGDSAVINQEGTMQLPSDEETDAAKASSDDEEAESAPEMTLEGAEAAASENATKENASTDKVAEEKATEEMIQETVETASETADSAKETAKEAADQIVEAADNVVEEAIGDK